MDKIRILHIDDSAHDRLLVKDALEKQSNDFVLVGVDSREKFEKHLFESDFDLVLSDFNILGFDGLQVLKIVKDKNPDMPVIIVTGTGSEEIAIQAMKMGASDYIIKSVNHIRGLSHTIQMVLENKRIQDERRMAIAAQRESEELYRSIYENTLVAILLISPETGRILSANDFACKLFNMNNEEFCFTGRDGIMDTSDTRFKTYIDEMSENGRYKGNLTFLKKGGIRFQAELSSSAFLTKEGHERGSIVIRDLTEQKMAEKKLKTLSKAIEQSPTSIIITDANGYIEFVNNKFIAVMQYSMNDVIGKKPRIFNPGHASEEVFEDMWETIKQGNVWQGENENRTKSGTSFLENVIISPLLKGSGSISNYIIIMEDITEKKKMLDDLIITKEKAEESDRLKTAFLHNISHEIRTPMNAIVGFSSFLSEPDLTPEKRKIFTDVIIQSSDQLLSIITEIIEVATIEAGQVKINVGEVNLNTLLKLLYDQFLLKVHKQNVTLSYKTFFSDEEALVLTDYIKLTEILSNLIGNAVKFTNHGYVDFGYSVNEKYLEFYIRDSGIGIPSEMHDEIFKRFRQVDYTSSRQFGGSGLGLSISKSYVELLGGNIWLQSEPNQGSAFYFNIPYRRVSPIKTSQLQADDETSLVDVNQKTLLIAEDEDTNYLLLVAFLSGLKINIIRAVNGAEAVSICRSNPNVNLVLMDIKMPEMDGFEATKIIKRFCPNLPILAQTAFISESDKQKAIACGCSDFIGKPIDQKELNQKIGKLLS